MHFGEGGYGTTEQQIRSLLGVGGPITSVPDTMPLEAQTPETYLGPDRFDASRYVGSAIVIGRQTRYTAATGIPQNAFSYGGEWTLSGQIATAGRAAALSLHFHAKDVYLVLAGHGRVTGMLGGRRLTTLHVNGDRLYTVLMSRKTLDGVLRLRFTPGVRAYSFTFG